MTSSIGFDVNIEVETQSVAALAVQGPTSHSVLTEAGIDGLDGLKPFGTADLDCRGIPVMVSRTGYTGDLGYELWVSPDKALALWDMLFAVKARYDVHAIGLSTLEMVRIEAGFVMPGFDFNTAESTVRANFDRSPYEVGLGWLVNIDKGSFTGRKALMAEKRRPVKRRLIKITVDGNKPVGEAFIFDRKNGNVVGEIKCATWSPILKANIALADIEYTRGNLPKNLWARIDYQRELKWMSTWAKCQATDKPFYSPEHRSATPPKRF
jgi:aminomethyltransferase